MEQKQWMAAQRGAMADDGEVDFSDRRVFSDPSAESFLDELLKNAHSCTHTHTCNPPGPDNTHTHTCFHTHTHLFAPMEGKSNSEESPGMASEQAIGPDGPCEGPGKKQTPGNREAVRKYREKKEAQTAFLEEQVRELKGINQQLLRKLQGQAALEAEVARLRSLLAEFRGRIEGELGSGPATQRLCLEPGAADFPKKDGIAEPFLGGYYRNSCNLPCDAEVSCFHSAVSNENGENGPSTPQEYSSYAGGLGPSCEVLNGGGCRDWSNRPKKNK